MKIVKTPNVNTNELNLYVRMGKPLIIKNCYSFKKFDMDLKFAASDKDVFYNVFDYKSLGFDLKPGDTIIFNQCEYVITDVKKDEQNEHVIGVMFKCNCYQYKQNNKEI